MNFLKSFMVLSFTLALTGCAPASHLNGMVISSKAVGRDITEHLVETDSSHTPYYIIRTNNKNLHQGSKVVLDLSGTSETQRSY